MKGHNFWREMTQEYVILGKKTKPQQANYFAPSMKNGWRYSCGTLTVIYGPIRL